MISFLSIIIVVYKPGFQLPINQEFQIFYSNHLFERYDFEFRNMFWFSRIDTKSMKNNEIYVNNNNNNNNNNEVILNEIKTTTTTNYVLPIRIVFGLLPNDNGNNLDPFDRGKLIFDENFNISSHSSQIWLLEFCRDIRSQPFYKPTLGPLLTNCFIETLYTWISKRKCSELIGNNVHNHFPCCELTKFPYEPYIFDYCSKQLIDRLHRTPNFIFNTQQAGPRFDYHTGKFKVLVIEYDSIYDGFCNSYENLNNIWNELNQWIQERLDMAPSELKNGWFITNNMEFYSLQNSLSTDVIKSLFISVLFAFITLILTTMNLNLSILSIITITFIIFSSISTLILFGWKLNIIESIVITLTIGLSIDSTLHYTIAYKTLTKYQNNNHLLSIQMTIARIGSPVAMATLTTFIAGSIMLFSNILAYIQIGIFLMIISFFSFIFSTFYHMSLLVVFGSTKSWNVFKINFSKFNFIWNWINKKRQSTLSSQKQEIKNFNSNNIDNEFEESSTITTTTTPRTSVNNIYLLRVTSI